MSSSVFRVSGAEGELGVSVVSSLGFKGTLRHGVESFGLAACGVKFAGCSLQWSMFKLSLKLRNSVAAKPSLRHGFTMFLLGGYCIRSSTQDYMPQSLQEARNCWAGVCRNEYRRRPEQQQENQKMMWNKYESCIHIYIYIYLSIYLFSYLYLYLFMCLYLFMYYIYYIYTQFNVP